MIVDMVMEGKTILTIFTVITHTQEYIFSVTRQDYYCLKPKTQVTLEC